jgi:two-component system NarL family sensor kinase
MGKIGRTDSAPERESLCREVAAAQEQLMGRVRGICDGLAPPDFRFQGLPDALRRLCYDFGSRTGIDCRIDLAENLTLEPLDEDMQLQIFRIVQEALINAEKHAGAREAVVVLRNSDSKKGRGLFVSVSDDGRGFPETRDSRSVRYESPPEAEPGHLGIRGMFERCAILNGVLIIESEEREGTMVYLEAPLEDWPDE